MIVFAVFVDGEEVARRTATSQADLMRALIREVDADATMLAAVRPDTVVTTNHVIQVSVDVAATLLARRIRRETEAYVTAATVRISDDPLFDQDPVDDGATAVDPYCDTRTCRTHIGRIGRKD